MGSAKSFEELKVWQDAEQLDSKIFKIYITIKHEDYALANQMNRCSGSIMDNIAEGFERNGNKEFIQYLSIAKGSCGELRSQLKRCLNRAYIKEEYYTELKSNCVEISKQISGLINYLKGSDFKGSKYS